MNEVMVFSNESINALRNPQLKKSLRAMLAALQTGRKSVWKYAESVHAIVTNETFVEDFETQTTFAKYVGLSKATITNYIKAVDFANGDDGKAMLGTVQDAITVGKAYMLSSLTHEQLADFISFYQTEGINLTAISDKALKDMLNELYGGKKQESIESEATEPDVTESDVTESDVTESEEAANPITLHASITDNYVTVTYHINGTVKERMYALDDEIIELVKIAKELM